MSKLEVQFRDEWLHRYCQISRHAAKEIGIRAHLIACYALEGLTQLVWRGLILGDINLCCEYRGESMVILRYGSSTKEHAPIN